MDLMNTHRQREPGYYAQVLFDGMDTTYMLLLLDKLDSSPSLAALPTQRGL